MAAAAAARRQQKKRQEAQRKRQEQEQELMALFSGFDHSKDGRLDKKELADLLQAVNKGKRPDEEELEYVFKIGDMSDGKADSDSIGMAEVKVAIQSWTTYCDNKTAIDAVFSKYDQDNTGKLEFQDLKKMLADLNDGVAPSDEEVSTCMAKAMGRHSGMNNTQDHITMEALKTAEGVSRMQVTHAISIWFSHLDETQKKDEAVTSSCCTVS